MNTPPPWPAGLWVYYYVQVDPDSPNNDVMSSWGQANWCRWWANQVATLEANTGPRSSPYPFFEINVPALGSQIQTDEGVQVFAPGSVT